MNFCGEKKGSFKFYFLFIGNISKLKAFKNQFPGHWNLTGWQGRKTTFPRHNPQVMNSTLHIQKII